MNTPISPSPELVAVVRRWNAAVQNKDGPALLNMLSTSEHLRYQGTAEGETWTGQVFRKGFPDHVAEIPPFEWDEHTLEAFECGAVGWAHCLASLHFPSTGTRDLHRFTYVLHLEHGIWKMVQLHVSNTSSNFEKMGADHSALEALIAAARDGFRHDQREGVASVMFTDIANSTQMATALGDQAWTDLMRRHLDMTREVIDAHEGRVVKSLGDGTMAIFAVTRNALCAAKALQSRCAGPDGPGAGLRIGIHTGDVIQTEDDFFGTVVNKAARVMDAADPGEICISDATRLLVRDDSGLHVTRCRQLELKGLPGLHDVHRLEWSV